MSDFILGVDLGQTNDYTALVVLERTAKETGRRVPDKRARIEAGLYGVQSDATLPEVVSHYAARHLERLPTGTPYPAQVQRVAALYRRLKHESDTHLVVDQTGVGRPVVDMLRAEGLSPAAVTITGGDAVSRDGQEYRVPKRDLVSAVQVLLQSERLKIAKGLAEAQTLTSELLAFKVNINLKGHDSYGNDVGPWRENAHDDLVLAVALACWHGENIGAPPPRRQRSFSYMTL